MSMQLAGKQLWRGAIAALLVAMGTTAVAQLPAQAQTGPNYSVGTPPDPVQLRPGDKAEATARVVNSTSRPTSFDVKIVAIDTHDEGSITEANANNDPAISFVTTKNHIDVAPDDSGVLPLSISVPKNTAPDIYFVGLLVTPSGGSAGGVQTIDRILSPIAIDVVGTKDYAISISQNVKHKFLLGSTLTGTYTISNKKAGVSVGRTVFVDRTFGGRVSVPVSSGRYNNQGQATSKEVVPRARKKTFAYSWEAPATTVGIVHPLIEISYVDVNGKTITQTSKGPGIFIITPPVAAIGAVVIVGVIGTILIKTLRRRSKRNGARRSP